MYPPEETEDLTGNTSSTTNTTPFLGDSEEIESLFETTENTTIFNVSDEKYWTSQGCTLWKVLQDIPSVKQKDYSVIVQNYKEHQKQDMELYLYIQHLRLEIVC